MHFFRAVVITVAMASLLFFAQSKAADLADSALVSAFQRDKGKLLCLSSNASLKEMREILNPYIKDIDLADQNSYPALAVAVYKAFPCPFSSVRPELKPASMTDLIGTWIFPDASLKLRHGPQSPSWRDIPGAPPIKCEGVSFHESGEYRVTQVRGAFACPTLSSMQAMRSLPQVSSWTFLPNGRVRIDRTDIPSQFEEWEVYSVHAPFEFFSVKFSVGDLVAYLRRVPGNEINAAIAFRHLQPLK